MRYIYLIILLLLFNGCSGNTQDKGDSMAIWCDKEKGVEYIRYYGGGLIVRIEQNGEMSTCKKIH